MMSRPDLLAQFIERAPTMGSNDETIELVIAGDFVDFLAIEPQASWTGSPRDACAKLEQTMREPPFHAVFTELGRLIHRGHRLTVMLGNHDIEMALPPVQEALLAHLDAEPHQVRFIDDGRAYRIGGALIEHGNAYDGANVNDWAGLGELVSSLSRFEEPRETVRVSAGSLLVEKLINPIKVRYPFVDLLQPQGELTLLLLLAFEPRQVGRHWKSLVSVLRAGLRERKNPRAGATRPISYQPGYTSEPEYDTELARAFGSAYEALRDPSPEPVALRDLPAIAFRSSQDSLHDILERGAPIPGEQLDRLRVALRKLVDEPLFRDDGDPERYGEAAERIRRDSSSSVDVVVMGHTHLARHIGPPDRATYINTGTWADVVRVPGDALVDGRDDELIEFLHQLLADQRPGNVAPTYGDLRIAPDGTVDRAVLARWQP